MPAPAAAVLLALCAAALTASCSDMGAAWNMNWTRSAARGRIMLVADHPQTLGLKRLESQSRLHPDLRLFLQINGRPDFLAETDSDGQRFLVFYYLDEEVAYAARIPRTKARGMKFDGPHPITAGEIELFGNLRAQHAAAVSSR
jgi:hypothetical protein